MADPVNGTPPAAPAVQVEPLKIATEVYLIDLLLNTARGVAAQCRLRGKLALAEKLENLVVMVGPGQAMPLEHFKNQLHAETYGKTESGLLLAGPGDLPRS